MGRIIKTIEIQGRAAVALFDTGALYTYVRSSFAAGVPRKAMRKPLHVSLGGQTMEISELCFVEGKIEGLDFVADAVAVAELGKADGQDLDAVIGALTLERWEIKLDPRTGQMDLEGLKRREFTEF
jgi:hypothetical protein